jgi:hypothetical protein
MTEPTRTTTESSTSDAYEVFVETLSQLGSTWAMHGLKIGRQALLTSAETIQKAAETLDTLAESFAKVRAHEAPAATANESAVETPDAVVTEVTTGTTPSS